MYTNFDAAFCACAEEARPCNAEGAVERVGCRRCEAIARAAVCAGLRFVLHSVAHAEGCRFTEWLGLRACAAAVDTQLAFERVEDVLGKRL
jgi:hypothetical protein